ncbi:MAG: hypothetical protein KatS3mg110_4440 [Pirellulaceae bacterium]|nr:MAG: hypothetical protein KatS3mg110_4440 [Pirellulaceae bacterium]
MNFSLPPEESGRERWVSPFEELLSKEAPMEKNHLGSASFEEAPKVIGTPREDAAFWDGQQSFPDTCAIRCQEFIIQQFTGVDISEEQLVQEAKENNWYTPGGGMPLEYVGNLLEVHGIPVKRFFNANQYALAAELAQGHKVIVAVDSNELWNNSHPIVNKIYDLQEERADHAVVVTGIDTQDPDHPHVIISDPGNGEVAARYPLEQFLDAWRDSNFFMVATQVPAPPHLPEMIHFDYESGHLPSIAGIPYQEFLKFEAQPELFEEAVQRYVRDLSDMLAHDLEMPYHDTSHLVFDDVMIPGPQDVPWDHLTPDGFDEHRDPFDHDEPFPPHEPWDYPFDDPWI